MTQRYLAYESARARLEVAEKAREQAEENLRLEKLRFAQSISTSTDVLDAQTRLTHAESNLVSARTDIWIALAGTRLALGQEFDPADFR